MQQQTSLDSTFGALFLGAIFASILYGFTNLQVYLYYSNFENDWSVQKYSVILLWALDSVHLGFTVFTMYRYLITSFGSVLALEEVIWPLKVQLTVNIVIICVVQILYTLRVWRLGRHYHRIWPTLVALVVAIGCVIGAALAVELFRISTWNDVPKMSWAIYTSYAWATGNDVVIAVAVCFYLIRSKAGFNGSNRKFIRVIRMILTSGCLTSACSLATLITYTAMPHNLVFVGIGFLLTKLYINSYLAMLNARRIGREAHDSKATNTNVTDVKTVSSSAQGLISYPPRSGDGHRSLPVSPVFTEFGSKRSLVSPEVHFSREIYYDDGATYSVQMGRAV